MKQIANRYLIKDKLGQGGSSITYRAIDKETNEEVAIKALSLTGLNDWKKIELFEREAKILQQLEHRCIPTYLDYFQIETEDNLYFYIVQQLAPGKSLAELISEGWQPEEATVKNIAEKVLAILIYLQQLTPPVIHRDIKPQNIIYQPDTENLFLVDFGAVQDTYHHTVVGSTVVGTYGYMAPEQYRGGAFLSTDLYSLGCTLLFILTGQSPAELPQKKLKIDFRNTVKIERNFANWIDKSIEPNLNNRLPTAEAALLVLQEKASLESYKNNVITKQKYSSIKVKQNSERVIIEIPPPYKRKRVTKYYYAWLTLGIISILNRLAIFMSVGLFGRFIVTWGFCNLVFVYGQTSSVQFQYFILISYILITKSIPHFSILLIAIDTILEISCKQNYIQRLLTTNQINISLVDPTTITLNKMIFPFATLNEENIKYKPYRFRAFLTQLEKAWLRSEIDRYFE